MRPCSAGPAPHRAPEEEQHEAIRAALEGGALFWYDLLAETQLEDAIALPALWDLVWAGEVTNDAVGAAACGAAVSAAAPGPARRGVSPARAPRR